MKVLSVRLSDKEFVRLKETLRNYRIHKPTLSEEVRVLFCRDLHRSRVFAKKYREINKNIITEI